MTPERREILRARLETIKELKAEYYVGSQDAFKYIKAMGYYEQLYNDVRENFGKTPLTLREIMVLSRKLMAMAQSALSLISVKFSAPGDLSLSVHQCIRDDAIPQNDEYLVVPDGKNAYFWRLDMAQLLRAYFAISALLKAMQKENFLLWSVSQFIANLKTAPFLIFETTGQRTSLKGVVDNPDLRRGTEADFWLDCEVSCELYEHQEEDEKDESLAEDYARLREYYDKRDLALCHQVLRQLSIGVHEIEEHFRSDARTEEWDKAPWLFDVSEEAEYYLLDGEELFRRAEREYTLGCLDIERRIALSYVFSYSRSGNESIKSLLDTAYSDASRGINTNNELLRMFESFEDPGPENIRAQKQRIWYYQYLRLAILKNRKWLTDFLMR